MPTRREIGYEEARTLVGAVADRLEADGQRLRVVEGEGLQLLDARWEVRRRGGRSRR